MKPQEINATIAKACPAVARIDGAGVAVWLNDSRKEFEPCSDLNAMHEAEKVLTYEVRDTFHGSRIGYEYELRSITGGSGDAIYATAAQRAESFLRCLNLWSHGGKEG